MNKLENYLDQQKYIIGNLNYTDFNYEDEEIFEDELTFLLENIYNIKVIDSDRKRLKQKEWAIKIKNKFNNQCVVSNDNADYLEACHLVEIKDNENYDINNGILLTRNLHKQFDDNLWCINPETYQVEVKKGVKGDIINFRGKKLNLPINYQFKTNLKKRYNNFKKKLI